MRLFDLHCDTATRLLAEKQRLSDNSLHISLKRAEYLTSYAQVMAVWTDSRLSDGEGYTRFFEVLENLKREINTNKGKICLADTFDDIKSGVDNELFPIILAVEDARILENDIKRLDTLKACGVKILTLNWYGDTCIGGAHNTHHGLTDFGAQVVERCFNTGIIPDISHCSFEGADEVLDMAVLRSMPVIASHSDSFSVNPHSRNLTDEHFICINRLGGLVGLNLCPDHLSSGKGADISSIMKHTEHYLSLGGENVLAVGGDFDGTNLPRGFGGIEDMYKLANEMQRLNYSTELTDKILFGNAFDFFGRIKL